MAHRQFEDRGRIVLYMETRDINALTAKAKREGRLLIPWLREIVLRELGEDLTIESAGRILRTLPEAYKHSLRKKIKSAPLKATFTDRASVSAIELKEGLGEHTAKSNRLTCMCASCVEYRRLQQIPLGGLKKNKK